MSKRALLEVIALDPEDAVAAQTGGADRLELVTDMAADGLTPSVATFTGIRAAVDLDLRVMLRLADGFAAGDVARLVGVAGELRAAGAEEFVLGFLTPRRGRRPGRGRGGGGGRWRGAGGRSTGPSTGPPTGTRCARRSTECPGWTPTSPRGAAGGVDDGMPTLLAEAGRQGEPGYEQQILVGGGLRLEHVPRLLDAGVTGFHIGGAARPEGWTGPVSAPAVARWRAALN
ncbi:copper homeostasis protein CutC [Streptomyces thermocoprophilus]